MNDSSEDEKYLTEVSEDVRDDVAEMPGTDCSSKQHEDELDDEWVEESFSASDPPAQY